MPGRERVDCCVVIPTYNAGHTVARAVESVLGQTAAPAQVVVVDDGSTDDTAAVMQSYSRRVRYIRIPHSGRPAVARNRGFAEAQAEFAAFLDADDWWRPCHLEVAVRALMRHPEAGLSYGDFAMVDEAGRLARVARVRAVKGNAFDALALYDFICTSTVVVRRTCLKDVGVFSEDVTLRGCEDWELWLRVARRYPIVHVAETLVLYQLHKPDASLASASQWLEAFRAVSRMILEQADLRQWERVAAWHAFTQARWYLQRGYLGAAHRLVDDSLRLFPALDRRCLFWLLTKKPWSFLALRGLRQRLGIAMPPPGGT